MRDAQALREQRRVHRRAQAARDHRFDPRIVHLRARPRAAAGHARQQLVARRLRGLRCAVRAQAAGRLRQHGQQGGFGMREPRRRLAEVGPAGGLHALDGAAERRAIQVQGQDFALREVRFQLQRAQQLAQLARGRARARSAQAGIDDARDLHGQGRTAGDDAPAAQQLPARAQQGQRIDAGMAPEPAVLVTEQGLQVERRDLFRRGRVAPHAVGIGERAQRAAVAGDHQHAGIAPGRQRQREQQVQQQQRRQQRHRAPAQPGQQPAPARARTACVLHRAIRAAPP
jgi:hypothetical protein